MHPNANTNARDNLTTLVFLFFACRSPVLVLFFGGGNFWSVLEFEPTGKKFLCARRACGASDLGLAVVGDILKFKLI